MYKSSLSPTFITALAGRLPRLAARARNGDYSAYQRNIQARCDTYYEYATESLQEKVTKYLLTLSHLRRTYLETSYIYSFKSSIKSLTANYI